MRTHGKSFILPLLAAAGFAIPFSSPACGPFFQPSYLAQKDPYTIEFRKRAAIRRFLDSSKDLFGKVHPYAKGIDTKKAAVQDFAAAVEAGFPDLSSARKRKMVEEFESFMKKWWTEKHRSMMHYPEFPEQLEEFRLYLAGCLEMDPSGKVPPSWKKLLELPPEKRKYRTVWVHFMLGNYRKAEAHIHYPACRKAAEEGFADTPGLALASLKNESGFGSDALKSMRAAATAQLLEPENDQIVEFFTRLGSGRTSGNDSITVSDKTYHELLKDPVCRELLSILDGWSTRFRYLSMDHKFRNADICAYYAYRRGDIEAAESFIASLEKPTLLSLYLEFKIARCHGNIPRAAKKLRQWLEQAENLDPADRSDILVRKEHADPWDMLTPEPMELEIYGLLGNIMVTRRDFMEAAEFFYRAGQIEEDFATVAEKYLSLDELVKFAGSVSADAAKGNPSKQRTAKHILHLTARRAFREGRFDITERFLPEQYKKSFHQYMAFMKAGNDASLGANERALALYNAAKILRYQGMELCGTEILPDNFRYGGNYGFLWPGCKNCKYDPSLGSWTFCKECGEDFASAADGIPGFHAAKDYRTVPVHMRFHYRYLAAELALRAGEIAEDKDLRALVHLFGGECLRLRSPAEADIFYKRLVLRSRGIPLSEFADQLRWFPEIPVLSEEIRSMEPCPSLDAVKNLMKQAFPPEKSQEKSPEK